MPYLVNGLYPPSLLRLGQIVESKSGGFFAGVVSFFASLFSFFYTL